MPSRSRRSDLRAPTRRRRPLDHARLIVIGLAWIASGIRVRVCDEGPALVVVPAAFGGATAEPTARAADAAPGAWRARALRMLASDHHSFRFALRRLGPPNAPGAATCRPAEWLIANGYDHLPQYAARAGYRQPQPAAGPSACVPAGVPSAWSPRSLHYSDVVTADLDRDGRDEIIATSFAQADGRMDGGALFVVPGTDPWREDPPPLAAGFAPSAVAVGDVDGDGRLDLVVATLTDPSDGGGARDVKHIRASELDGPTLLFRGDAAAARGFAPARAIAAPGAVALRLADVDLDGALDVVAAGASLSVTFGPELTERVDLPLPDDLRSPFVAAVDVAWSPDGRDAFIAASLSCMSGDECALETGALGVEVWRMGRGAARAASVVGFWPTPGIPSPVRFDHLDDDDRPDLVVGLMTSADGDDDAGRPRLGPGVSPMRVGARPLVRSAVERDGRVDFAPAWEAIDLTTPAPAFPMASSITLVADAKDATVVTTREPAGHVVTWLGRGALAGVGAVRDGAGRALAFDFVPGDRHASVAAPPDGGLLEVDWWVAERPSLVVTSACPIAGSAAGTLFIKPPERVRSADRSL